MENALRAAHFPQDIDVDRALPVGDLMRQADLGDGAVDGVFDEFLMPFAAGCGMIDLRDDLARRIVAVGVDRADRADAARRRPGTRAGMVGRGDALAPLD